MKYFPQSFRGNQTTTTHYSPQGSEGIDIIPPVESSWVNDTSEVFTDDMGVTIVFSP